MTGLRLSPAVTLTGPRFLAAWQALDLGEPPPELELRPTGATLADARRVQAADLDALSREGLADLNGPCPALAGMLRLLAQAPLTLDLRLSSGLFALAARTREHAVLLVRDDDELRLTEIPARHAGHALVDLIGPLRGARARTVNIPAETLDNARRLVRDGSLWTLADHLTEHGVDRADARSLARMCTGITATGQLGALADYGRHTERRGRWVIGFHRAAAGDFIQLRRHGCVTVAPITTDRLLAHLDTLTADTRNAPSAI